MQKRTTDNVPFIVGIGASAGGLEALQDFFKAVPENTNIAFVVVQHLSPDYKSLMDELLARFTPMTINIVKDGMRITGGVIYLIPPRKNMTIYQNKLFLQDQANTRGLNLPIDIFFRSLAKEKGRDAIGIILSGTGSDGTLGIRAIKEAGGMVMVQDDKTAKFNGMPRSSISTGLVDYILPAEKMPEELINYVKHPFIKKPRTIDQVITHDDDVLSKILMLIRDYSGLDYSYYKEKTILRRLEKRLGINRIDSFEEYIQFLNESDREKDILFKELLIGVTRFFRDVEAYGQIKDKVIPGLFKTGEKLIRIWSVACSTGEEVYSLAMLFFEYMEEQNIRDTDIKIFATDIDKEAIEYAGIGFYPDNIQADVEPEFLNKYFLKKTGGYQIREHIRKSIVFATHNILKDPPFSKIDLISCRNLFIYLKPSIQQNVLSMFYYSLNEDGYLFLGSSESMGEFGDGFTVKDSKWKIFKYKKGFQPPVTKRLPYSYKGQPLQNEPLRQIKSQSTERVSIDSTIYQVLDAYVPPSVVVDDQNNLLHIINNVNKYLNFNSGRFEQSLVNLAENSLKLPLNTLTRKLRNDKKDVVLRDVPVEFDDDIQYINLIGKTLYDRKKDAYYYLISFEENKESANHDNQKVVDVREDYDQRFTDLERELQYTRENLQATVEELETSNEELQSSNEELIASNEELQSTNEELQSVNEELYTVNAEYQNKIEELERLNNDMNNLLRNTKIGTIYLDRKLCIRKMTESVYTITHLRESDIGRPVYHMDLNSIYPAFLEDIEKVLEDLKPVEKEFQVKNQDWYLSKIMPYRTDENAVDGIIITFVNINSLKRAQDKTAELANKLTMALDIGKMAWWEWNVQTREVTYSDKKATMLGYTVEEFPTDIYKMCDLIHPRDYDETMQIMRDYIEGKRPAYEAFYRIKTKQGDYKWFYDRGGGVEKDKDGKPLIISGIVIDVSELKGLESDMKLHRDSLMNVLNNSPMAKMIVTPEGKIVYFNHRAADLFGLTEKDINRIKYNSRRWKLTDTKGENIPAEKMPYKQVVENQKPVFGIKHILSGTKKEPVQLSVSGSPLYNSRKEIRNIVLSIEQVTNN